MPNVSAEVVGRWRGRRPAAGRRRRCPAGRGALLVGVGGLLLGLAGCGAERGGGREARVAGSAIAVSPLAVAATPAASSVAEILIGRPADRVVGGPPVPPTPGGSPVPFRSAVAEIGPIAWTTAVDPRTNEPLAVVDAFPVDAPTIIATVSVGHWAPAVPISADWSYNGTPLDGFATTVIADDAKRDVWLAFRLTKSPEASWPDGIYAIALLVDGQAAQAASVVVGGEG